MTRSKFGGAACGIRLNMGSGAMIRGRSVGPASTARFGLGLRCPSDSMTEFCAGFADRTGQIAAIKES